MRVVSDTKRVRPPRVAGSDGFYPDDPVALTHRLAQLFTAVKGQKVGGTIAGLVVPHAGYDYSGLTAAAAYKQLEGLSFSTVIVIAPSHFVFFRGCSVYSGGAYRTPLGEIPLDLEFCARLTGDDPTIALSDDGHESVGGRFEHALEVQLPFLQIVIGQFSLVPVIMGDQEYTTAKRLGEAIGRLARLGKTLVIASSDLAHGHDFTTTKRMDATAASAIENFRADAFYDLLKGGAFEACGGGPIAAAMIAARAMGADTAINLAQTNSGEVTGRRHGYLVGYLSAAFVTQGASPERGAKPTAKQQVRDLTDPRTIESDQTLDSGERELLRATARRSLERAVKGAPFECPEPATSRLNEKRGVFVSLHLRSELRGCVGYVRPFKPLIEAIWEMTESAALRDHRFIPVEPKEVDALTISLTVLSPLQRISNPDDVLVGRHGLVVSQGHRSGVLLPQVPIEHGWDRETFLTETCKKAGLAPDAWRDPATVLEIFTAEVF